MVNVPDHCVPMRVENRGGYVPLATATCDHGREMAYNLSAGFAAHVDDSSPCRQTGLPYGVDEELASRDRLSDAVITLLGDASARLDAMLKDGGSPW